MSPYGAAASKPPRPTCAPTSYSNDKGGSITVYHLTVSTCPPDLLELLYKEFEAELERGRTYPQEGPIGLEGFKAYYFAGDVFVGIIAPSSVEVKHELKGVEGSVEAAKAGRKWEECVAGAYYIKDNYPGRSSHICNAGFIVPPTHRGKSYGSLLGSSYLHYAPLLGYRASIFNLVYVNNTASVRIWERLGFRRVGLIPGAGRLRMKDHDGEGEEYVDAGVWWKSFVDKKEEE